MMHEFSLFIWCGYLHERKNINNDFSLFNLGAFRGTSAYCLCAWTLNNEIESFNYHRHRKLLLLGLFSKTVRLLSISIHQNGITTCIICNI